MQVVLLFDSALKSGNVGASKQLANDLKAKSVQHYGVGEAYKKLSQRFQLSVSMVRSIRRVGNNPQAPSKDPLGPLAAVAVAVHSSTVQCTVHKDKLYGRVMPKRPFLRRRHKLSRWRLQEHMWRSSFNLEKGAVDR